jgi:hypothetical protein
MSGDAWPQLARAIDVNQPRLVAERWRRAYHRDDGRWLANRLSNASDIYNNLIALGTDPTPDDIALVIGNKSWTHLSCEACPGEFLELAQLRPESDCHTFRLCRGCLTRGLAVYNKESLHAD